jgi:hypothetical protein
LVVHTLIIPNDQVGSLLEKLREPANDDTYRVFDRPVGISREQT